MQNWQNKIDAITQKFEETFGALSPEQLNWKPNAQTWSVAQNVDHLITINRSYFPAVASMKEGTYVLPFLARFGFVVTFFGNMILKSVDPNRTKKIKTFSIWEPSKSELPKEIIAMFTAHQTELKEMIMDSKALIDRGAIISSPANQNIVYKLETAFEIIVTHEQRHFNQALEVLELLRRGVVDS